MAASVDQRTATGSSKAPHRDRATQLEADALYNNKRAKSLDALVVGRWLSLKEAGWCTPSGTRIPSPYLFPRPLTSKLAYLEISNKDVGECRRKYWPNQTDPLRYAVYLQPEASLHKQEEGGNRPHLR